jgi:undecaprenyl-diphosphatase
MVRKFLATLTFLTVFALHAAEPAATPAAPTTASAAAAELSATDAIILGVVEGVTEFLPISSTGHLIIATRFLHLESEAPLLDANGQPLWYKKPSPKRPNGEPLTLKLAADTFTVVIQFGAIAAVALLYWSQLMAMLRGLMGRDPAGRQLLINLIVAFLPAAVIGFLAHDWIDANLFSVKAVIVAQVAGAILMLAAEKWRHNRDATRAATFANTSPPFATAGQSAVLTPKKAATIGLLQCFAMWPGTSRSMMTIVGGYFVGMDPKRSAEFSFLLGFITLSAASVYKSYKSGAAMIAVFGVPHVVLGAVVAAVTAAVCVKFLVSWLTRHGLAIFAWYRIAVAIALGVVFYLWK